MSPTSGFPLVAGENHCECPQLTSVSGRQAQRTRLTARQFPSRSFDKMVLARRTPTALASHERKPAIVHVSPETMIRKHGEDKDLWSQDHRSSYHLSHNIAWYMKMPQRTPARTFWVRLREHTTSASGGREPKVPITPSNLVGGPEKRKRLDVVATSKRSSEVVARLDRKCPRRQPR